MMSDTLLPPNASDTEIALDISDSRVSDVPTPARSLADPQSAPASSLPWLAWGVSVDEWQTDWSEQQKRDVIAASNAVHRYKGTIGAVREALSALGYLVEVQEWFNQQPPAAPYTFRLHVSVEQAGVPAPDWDKLLLVVNNAKNLRSHLDGIDVVISSDAAPVMGAATMMGHEIFVEFGGGNLRLDGTWKLDGSQRLSGIKLY